MDTKPCSPAREMPSAVQATDLAVTEAEPTLPLYLPGTPEHPGGYLIRWVDDDEARLLVKQGLVDIVRDRHTHPRRLVVSERKLVKRLKESQRGSVITDASRTVRREQLQAPLWCFSPIMQNLEAKKAVQQEELIADGIVEAISAAGSASKLPRRRVRPMGRAARKGR